MKIRLKLAIFLCIIFCVSVFIGVLPRISAGAHELGSTITTVGDIDGDGDVTGKDVTLLRRFLAGGWEVAVDKKDADIDQDGEVTAKDVTMLRRYLAGGWGVVLPKKTILSEVNAKNYYYSQLNMFEKDIYDNVKRLNWDNDVLIIQNTEEYSFNEICDMCYKAFTALISDNPRYKYYWWTNWNCIEEDDQVKLVLKKNEVISEYGITKADTIARNIVNSIPIGTDMYTAIRDITTYIKINTEYDPYYPFNSNTIGMYNDTALGVFLKKSAVCAGYADATKILFDMLDIPCIIVGNAGHAWNYIQMEDGNWYALDMSVATYLVNVNETERNDFILNNTFLCGSTDYQYQNESNYHLSELYIANPSDFVFPVLSEKNYVYKSEYRNNMKPVEDFEDKDGEYIYSINDDAKTCKIIAFEGKESGNLCIPSEINGYNVSVIGDGAFYHLQGFSGNLIIPDSVVEIESGAFKNCSNLSGQLILSKNLEKINSNVFVGCKNLSGSLNLPDSLMILGRSAFYDCRNFSGDLIIPDKITELDNCFEECTGFDGKIIISSGLTDWDCTTATNAHFKEFIVAEENEYLVAEDGVLYSKNLKTLIACPMDKEGDLIIPDTVTEIKPYACYGCKRLKNIRLPKCLEIIGERAFEGCSGIRCKLLLPENVRIIGDRAFWIAPTYDDSQNGFIGDLIIPDSVVEIGMSAFYGNYFGGNLKLSANIQELKDETFMYCKFTGDLIIPDKVKYIGAHVFDSQSANSPSFIDRGELFLPENIEKIGIYAFMGAGLSGSINISGVEVGENAFLGNYFDSIIE